MISSHNACIMHVSKLCEPRSRHSKQVDHSGKVKQDNSVDVSIPCAHFDGMSEVVGAKRFAIFSLNSLFSCLSSRSVWRFCLTVQALASAAAFCSASADHHVIWHMQSAHLASRSGVSTWGLELLQTADSRGCAPC